MAVRLGIFRNMVATATRVDGSRTYVRAPQDSGVRQWSRHSGRRSVSCRSCRPGQLRTPRPCAVRSVVPGGADTGRCWHAPVFPVLVMMSSHSRFCKARMIPSRTTGDLLAGIWMGELIRSLYVVQRLPIWDVQFSAQSHFRWWCGASTAGSCFRASHDGAWLMRMLVGMVFSGLRALAIGGSRTPAR